MQTLNYWHRDVYIYIHIHYLFSTSVVASLAASLLTGEHYSVLPPAVMPEDSSAPGVLDSHCDYITPTGVVPKNDAGQGVARGGQGGEEGGAVSNLTGSLLDEQLFSDKAHQKEEEEEQVKEMREEVGAKGDLTPEELNKRFQSQTLDSSWSSSSDTNNPEPRSPEPPAPPQQPRLRPEGGGSASALQKHFSQPPVGSQAPPGCTRARNALSMLRPLPAGLGQEVVAMETGGATPEGGVGGCDRCSPPPTPPLHRLPSWVRVRPEFFLAANHSAGGG